MIKNLYSLGLLRNGKVYASKELAKVAMTNEITNDGVAKLCRYLEPVVGGDPVIRTLVGFYANASEMTDAGGGRSSYTILDIDGNAAELENIREQIDSINDVIGNGIQGTTLTAAINSINNRLGEGFTPSHTVADALAELESAITESMTVTLEASDDPDYAKVYTLKQGGTSIGTINIPKDIVVKDGSLVHGTWSGDTFIEDEQGEDIAIKLVLNNDDVIYINAKDLVDTYTAGDGISLVNNEISIKYNNHSESFLVVDSDGIMVQGIQAAIDAKADAERLEASDGISIVSNKVKAVAAAYSAPAIKNPITVGEDGIKFDSTLDCGFFDDETVIASTTEDIAAITEPQNTDIFVNGKNALNALSTQKTFKNIQVSNVEASQQVYLNATDSIAVDNVEVTGDKGSTNGYFLIDANDVEVSNISVADGAKPYNIFEGSQSNTIDSFKATNVTVDDVSLQHNVFNIYKPQNDAVISITGGKFNMNVNNSNVLRLANYANATGVTVEFEDVEWTYENTPSKDSADWGWAGLIIYQPSSTDTSLGGDLTALRTWKFNFKNCKYDGVKVTANNFGEKNQVFYMYNIGNVGGIIDPVENGLDVTFE
jgi:hypothetical protein